jgi:hypothetical protein
MRVVFMLKLKSRSVVIHSVSGDRNRHWSNTDMSGWI